METSAEAQVATKRITSLLMQHEVRVPKIEGSITTNGGGVDKEASSTVLRIEDADFSWSDVREKSVYEEVPPPTSPRSDLTEPLLPKGGGEGILSPSTDSSSGEGLSPQPRTIPDHGGEAQVRGVSLSLRKGELIIVVGQVGAGKTSLVEGILGE